MATPAQIIEQGALQHQARRQQLQDEQRAQKLSALENVLNSISSDDPEAVSKRQSILQAMGSLYHPHEGKDFLKHLSSLAGRLVGQRPTTVAQPPAITVPGEGTQLPAAPATTVKGPHFAKGPAPKKHEDEAATTAQLIAQNYRSPEEIAAEAQLKQGLKQLQAKYALYNRLYSAPGVTEDQKHALGSLFGFAERPVYKEYQGPQGQRAWFDAARPDTIPVGWNATAGVHLVTKLLNVKGKGWSQVSYDPQTRTVSSIMPGAAPPRSLLPTRRTSTTTDPFGVTSTTSSLSQPIFRSEVDLQVGAPISESVFSDISSSPSIEEMGSSQPAVVPPAGGPPSAPGPGPETKGRGAGRGPGPKKPPTLDAQGHIPESSGINNQLRQAANNLLDGMDVGKLPIPQRDRAAAMELASKYGWKQGLFTPRETLQIRESETFLREARGNPSMTVLNDLGSREKLANAIEAGEKNASFLTRQLATLFNLNPKEQEFLRMYRQLVGTIQGLRNLTASGRATEAAIGRLMTELPNPRESHSAEDGKQRLDRLMKELQVAQEKGYLADSAMGPAPKANSDVIDVSPEELNQP